MRACSLVYDHITSLGALERWCVCRGGPTNQNKLYGKSRGDQYIGGLPRF